MICSSLSQRAFLARFSFDALADNTFVVANELLRYLTAFLTNVASEKTSKSESGRL